MSDVKRPIPKKLEPVVKGKKKTKKNYKNVFMQQDLGSIGSYIVMDVLIPACKKAAVDIVTNGINMLFYGETKRGSERGSGGYARTPYVSYSEYSRDDRRDRSYSTGYGQEDIIYETRREAEDVLASLDAQLEQYGMVSVADYKDVSGVTGSSSDYDFGWTNLRAAKVVRCRDGYFISLPRPKPLP